MSDFIPTELGSDITENEIVEEIVQVEVDDIVEDSVNKPLDSEPEPIADYSENEVIDSTDINDEVVYIQVENSSYALGILAKNYFHDPSSKLKLVGITGTNGKTTTATLSYDLFSSLGYCCGLISTIVNKIADKNFPTERTTPDVLSLNKLLLEMVEAKCEFVFMEVSSHAVVQHRIAGLSFFGGVFSNITHDHLDYHKTFDNYRDTKKVLFDRLGKEAFAITNVDDRNGLVMTQNCQSRVLTYSTRSMADFRGKILEEGFDGMLLRVQSTLGAVNTEVFVPLVGRFNVSNLLLILKRKNYEKIGRECYHNYRRR